MPLCSDRALTIPVIACPQVLATVADNSVRVWDAYTGRLLQRLEGHNRAVHTLEAHPWHSSLALSGSYDGNLIVWDIAAGRQVAW